MGIKNVTDVNISALLADLDEVLLTKATDRDMFNFTGKNSKITEVLWGPLIEGA